MDSLKPDKELPSFERIILKLQKRKDGKGWPFNTGILGISINAGLVGLVSNSYFRRMLKVRKLLLFTSLPMVVIPAISILPMWTMYVAKPIVEGDLSCDICAQMRGAALNVTFGLLYPCFVSIPLVASIALRYKTVDIPKVGFSKEVFLKQMKFWSEKSRFFKSQFISLAFFQFVVGMYIAHKQYVVAQEFVHKPNIFGK
ncbi:transmembrane protein 126A-like [Antedon mediterranea]|uniref:transmembrane protein 126A-like n=1 Tax=Antedon mediterranea TaxID=105859 RepID=UPI003AF4B612